MLHSVLVMLCSAIASLASAAPVEPLVQEADVKAPVEEVWRVFTTKEGIEAWMVRRGEVNLEVGGWFRSTYDPNETLGGDKTIINTILAYEPQRMLALRCTQAPSDFPHKEIIAKTWTVISMEPIGSEWTRVRFIGLGYDDSEPMREMRKHFEWGNDFLLDRLCALYSDERGVCAEAPVTSDFRLYRASLAAAQAAIEAGRIDEAQGWLSQAPESERHTEWGILWAMTEGQMTRSSDEQPPASALGAVLDEGGLRIRRSESSTDSEILIQMMEMPRAVALSPDDLTAATAESDGSVRLWSAETGRYLRTIHRSGLSPAAIAFSSDGRRLAVATDDLTILDVSRGMVVAWLPLPFAEPTAVAFSADDSSLSCSGRSGAITWTAATPARHRPGSTPSPASQAAQDVEGPPESGR